MRHCTAPVLCFPAIPVPSGIYMAAQPNTRPPTHLCRAARRRAASEARDSDMARRWCAVASTTMGSFLDPACLMISSHPLPLLHWNCVHRRDAWRAADRRTHHLCGMCRAGQPDRRRRDGKTPHPHTDPAGASPSWLPPTRPLACGPCRRRRRADQPARRQLRMAGVLLGAGRLFSRARAPPAPGAAAWPDGGPPLAPSHLPSADSCSGRGIRLAASAAAAVAKYQHPHTCQLTFRHAASADAWAAALPPAAISGELAGS